MHRLLQAHTRMQVCQAHPAPGPGPMPSADSGSVCVACGKFFLARRRGVRAAAVERQQCEGPQSSLTRAASVSSPAAALTEQLRPTDGHLRVQRAARDAILRCHRCAPAVGMYCDTGVANCDKRVIVLVRLHRHQDRGRQQRQSDDHIVVGNPYVRQRSAADGRWPAPSANGV